MVLWLLFLFPLSTFASIEKTHGVPPSLLSRYEKPGSASAPWSCLDGSKTITWASVNDDYCDCSDGSDEPGQPLNGTYTSVEYSDSTLLGTGACPNTVFYCRNEGHIGAYIPSTRVGDGLCGTYDFTSSSESSSY